MRSEANKAVSIFQAHGEIDRVVQFVWGKGTKDVLSGEMGHPVEWHSYPNLDHSADTQEMDDLQKWLEKRVLPES